MHCTRHRVFLATLIVTAKYLNDSSPKNKHWAKYASMFSLAEVTLMEKQLLYLLDYDLRMSEAELLQHFQPFLRRTTPPAPPAWSPPAALRTPQQTLRHVPSLEACSPTSTASSRSPVTPGTTSDRSVRDMLSPTTSPVRRAYHIHEKSPFTAASLPRASTSSSATSEDEELLAAAQQSRRRLTRGSSVASLQAAAQQAARRGSAAAHYGEHIKRQEQQQMPIQLNLPFTSSELAHARREAAQQPQLRTKTSSGVLASFKGYFKGINSSRDHSPSDSADNTITVDGGIRIVQ